MSQSFCKMSNITTDSIEMAEEDIKINSIKILDCIQQIAKEKYKSSPNQEIMNQTINEVKSTIPAKKPFIFQYDDFDNKTFYKNIIQIASYYIINFDTSTLLDKFICKNLIDIASILKSILKNNNNSCENVDVKFYMFHSINVFSPVSNEIEKSSKFLKIGIKQLLDRYKIENFEEFFLEEERQKIKKNFLDSIINLITKIEKPFHKTDLSEKNTKLLDEISFFKDEIKSQKETPVEKFNLKVLKEIHIKIKNFISELLLDQEYFLVMDGLLNHFMCNLPPNINDFYYSLEYIRLKKLSLDDYKEKYLPNDDLFQQYYEYEDFSDLLRYIIKLKKYKKLIKIYNGNESFEKEFKDIIKDEQFRQKVKGFYNSNKMQNFITKYVDPEEKENVFAKLKELKIMMDSKDFWEKIYFFPLTKYKKSFVTNYLRIIINTSFITLKVSNQEEKIKILTFLLFQLIVHEIFHLLRRLIYCGKDSLMALTPPNGKDLEDGEVTGEIGERLIGYFFNINKIQRIILEQAEYFVKADLNKEEEIEKLFEIFNIQSKKKLKEISYAKFNESEKEREILFEIQDCRKFVYVPPFNYRPNNKDNS